MRRVKYVVKSPGYADKVAWRFGRQVTVKVPLLAAAVFLLESSYGRVGRAFVGGTRAEVSGA